MLDFDFRRIPRLGPVFAVLHTIGLHDRVEWIRTDRTRRGWHVLISLDFELTPGEIVALQSILGSDRRRESLNLMRAISITRNDPGPYWRSRWNLLFQRKVRTH